jgi:hypothetical protein
MNDKAVFRRMISRNTVQVQLSALIGTARRPDMQKIRVTGFFFENRTHWQLKVEKIYPNSYF